MLASMITNELTMKQQRQKKRVLGIDPVTRGFGFAIFEGPELLIDWGVAHVRTDKHAQCLNRVERLMDRYRPEVIVVENAEGESSRRCERVKTLLKDAIKMAVKHNIEAYTFSRSEVRKAFASSGATTKEQIAGILAARHPELLPYLPPHRKCWMSEDVRISIFDAAALGHAFFKFHK